MVPPGPQNPLGPRALYLGDTLYRIHGTNRPGSIGGAVSHGCFRMYNPSHHRAVRKSTDRSECPRRALNEYAVEVGPSKGGRYLEKGPAVCITPVALATLQEMTTYAPAYPRR